MLNRSLAPEAYPLCVPVLPKPQREVFANGIEWVWFEGNDQHLVNIDLIFPANRLSTHERQTEAYMYKMLLEGTASKSAKQFADAVSFLGANIEISHHSDYDAVHILCLGRVLDEVMDLVNEMWQSPSFPEKEWKTIKETTLHQHEVNLQKTSYLAGRELRRTLFGSDIEYGYSIDPKMIETLDLDQFKAQWQQKKQVGPALALVAGRLSSESAVKLSNWLKSYPACTKPNAAALQLPKPKPEIKRILKEGAMQATLQMATWSLARTHKDFSVFSLMLEIFGGYFGSRLMSNIREEKGWTYGIYAQRSGLLRQPYWLIGADLKGDVAEAAVEEIRKEAELMRSEPVSEEELDLVKNYMLGQFLSSVPHCFALADKFLGWWLNGLDLSVSQHNMEQLLRLDAEAVLQAAQTYLHPEEMVTVICGPEA